MGKLLLMLTLVAFSSGVLCNVAQNLTEDGSTADTLKSQFYNTAYKLVKVCANGNLRDDYVVFQGMGAYKLHARPMTTWNDARKICINEGGTLAIINSDTEARMLVDWMRAMKVTAAWIGIHDMFEYNNWVTLTGESLGVAGYDRWEPGEPDNAGGNEHCGTFGDDNGINDLTCNQLRSYWCKIILC